MERRLIQALLIAALLPSLSSAQAVATASNDSSLTVAATEAHLLPASTRRVELRHGAVAEGSLTASVNGVPWTQGVDFRVDEPRGLWLALRSLAGEQEQVPVVFAYRYHPAPLPLRAELHPVVTRPAALDSLGTMSLSPSGERQAFGSDWGDLDVTGSKTVRMASGSRRELTVDQNLRLNIAGRLTEDISVRAVLSDDNLPVVPEGNTEELRDIDRVRVDVTAPRWRAVLGDFVARRDGTVFGDYRRKLQGALVETRGGEAGGELLAGSPRGRYRTAQLRGQESNQGPYVLGSDAGAVLFLVAGSERVFLDGEQLVRGADRDYVVDYIRGTVTFTYKRLITAESEIVVEYEEGEGPFARSVAGGGATARLAGGAARFGVRLIQEGDDPDRPRNGELSDEDRDAIAAAGDDPELAVTNGLTPTTPGDGHYRLEDSAGVAIAVWDTITGDLDAVFHYVGVGHGDYVVDSLTQTGVTIYAYRGPGEGAWRLGRRLEIPERQRLVTLQTSLGDTLAPWLAAEWHMSDYDANVLSARDDGDDGGRAWRAALNSGKHGFAGGEVALAALHEDLGDGFRPFLLARDLFRYERWGLGDRVRRVGFLDERDALSQIDALWTVGDRRRRLELKGVWDRLDHGSDLEANSLDLQAEWRLGSIGGRHQRLAADANDSGDPLEVTRSLDAHRLDIELGPLRPAVDWLHREYVDEAATGSSQGSRLRRWGAELAAAPERPWSWRVGWARGLADSSRSDGWRRERDARTVDWRLGSPAVAGMRLNADGTWRRTLVPDGADLSTRLAKVRLTGRWPSLGSDWGLIYGVDNSRTEVLDRQIVFVGDRLGDYNQGGDYVGHELGDYRVVTVGTDSLVATTEVTADLTWRQDFGVLGDDRWWGGWSTFTRLTTRGRSRTEDTGRLLRLDRGAIFDERDAVLGEVSLRQDVNLLRHLRDWDLRLRYDLDETLDRQYATHPERRLRRTHQSTLVRNLGRSTAVRWRTRREFDRRRTEETGFSSNRSYGTVVWHHEVEPTWRGAPGNQLAVAVDHARRSDDVSGVEQREWGVKPSARWRLARRWSGTAEVRWANVASDEAAGALRPFFFPYPGVNVDVITRLTWDPSRTMSVTLSHFSRRLGDQRGWQHDVRLESTARF